MLHRLLGLENNIYASSTQVPHLLLHLQQVLTFALVLPFPEWNLLFYCPSTLQPLDITCNQNTNPQRGRDISAQTSALVFHFLILTILRFIFHVIHIVVTFSWKTEISQAFLLYVNCGNCEAEQICSCYPPHFLDKDAERSAEVKGFTPNHVSYNSEAGAVTQISCHQIHWAVFL